MFRKLLLVLIALLMLAFAAPYIEGALHAATCVGADPCNACENCKYCTHCVKNGKTCGVCRRAS